MPILGLHDSCMCVHVYAASSAFMTTSTFGKHLCGSIPCFEKKSHPACPRQITCFEKKVIPHASDKAIPLDVLEESAKNSPRGILGEKPRFSPNVEHDACLRRSFSNPAVLMRVQWHLNSSSSHCNASRDCQRPPAAELRLRALRAVLSSTSSAACDLQAHGQGRTWASRLGNHVKACCTSNTKVNA